MAHTQNITLLLSVILESKKEKSCLEHCDDDPIPDSFDFSERNMTKNNDAGLVVTKQFGLNI